MDCLGHDSGQRSGSRVVVVQLRRRHGIQGRKFNEFYHRPALRLSLTSPLAPRTSDLTRTVYGHLAPLPASPNQRVLPIGTSSVSEALTVVV